MAMVQYADPDPGGKMKADLDPQPCSTDCSTHLLGRLPLGQLSETLLSGPDGGVDDLEEELPRPRVEDEDGPVDRLGRQVALKGLVDGDAVHVGVVHKPDDLVAKELAVVL